MDPLAPLPQLTDRTAQWCDAHEWVQALPLSANRLRCMRCDHQRDMLMGDGIRCKLHAVHVGAGWLPIEGAE